MLAYHARKTGIVSRPVDPSHDGLVALIKARCVRRESGCLEWTGAGSGTGKGYGRIRHHGRLHSPHRVMLEWSLGRTLAGLEDTCHRCDNPRCVEPDHLFAGSRSDNMRDAYAKGRLAPPRSISLGERNGAAKLTAASTTELKADRALRGMSVANLSSKYGVGKSAIYRLLRGETWGHIPYPAQPEVQA